MDAFELEYEFVHVRAFNFVVGPGKMIFAVLELWLSHLHRVLNWEVLTFIFAVLLEYHFRHLALIHSKR